MSSTPTPTTAAIPSATPSGCGALLYNIPTQDASCALPYGGNHTDVLRACCGASVDIVAYQDNCGLYCLAEDQSVTALADCLQTHGALPQDVFCRGVGNATATGKSGDEPLASGASVVPVSSATATAGRGNASDDGDGGSQANGAAGSGSGLGVGGMIVTVLMLSSVMFGFLQI